MEGGGRGSRGHVLVGETEDDPFVSQVAMRGRETCPYLLHERIVAGVENNGTPERRGLQDVFDDVADGPGCRYFTDGDIVILIEDRGDMTGTT